MDTYVPQVQEKLPEVNPVPKVSQKEVDKMTKKKRKISVAKAKKQQVKDGLAATAVRPTRRKPATVEKGEIVAADTTADIAEKGLSTPKAEVFRSAPSFPAYKLPEVKIALEKHITQNSAIPEKMSTEPSASGPTFDPEMAYKTMLDNMEKLNQSMKSLEGQMVKQSAPTAPQEMDTKPLFQRKYPSSVQNYKFGALPRFKMMF